MSGKSIQPIWHINNFLGVTCIVSKFIEFPIVSFVVFHHRHEWFQVIHSEIRIMKYILNHTNWHYSILFSKFLGKIINTFLYTFPIRVGFKPRSHEFLPINFHIITILFELFRVLWTKEKWSSRLSRFTLAVCLPYYLSLLQAFCLINRMNETVYKHKNILDGWKTKNKMHINQFEIFFLSLFVHSFTFNVY